MGREIKFRVWDKDLKKMHVCGENVHDSMSFVHNQACYYNLQNGCGSLPPTYDGEGTYELMQYTGLKDKNGKESYENDLCENSGTIYQIVWVDKFSRYGLKVIKTEYVLTKNQTFPMWQFVDEKTGNLTVEVIGNIFENPDLIKDGF